MRLSNHQKDATWDIRPVLVSRRPVPIDGEPRGVIFSLLWNWRSLSSQLRESFSLEEQKHISVWRTSWWYTQASFPMIHTGIFSQEAVWSSNHILASRASLHWCSGHRDRPLLSSWRGCIRMAWLGVRLWGQLGLRTELPPYEQGDLGRSLDFLKPQSLHLWTIRIG